MYGQYGMTAEFDFYGINAVDMWYDAEDAMLSSWMCGETHAYILLDENGDYFCHEADLGPDAIFRQPLGPKTPYLQGPRPITDVDEYGSYAIHGINH